MPESKLRTCSLDFAVHIINLVKFLKEQRETIISNQIGRSGTSIGANIHEAQYAHGKADFVAKFQIALHIRRKRNLSGRMPMIAACNPRPKKYGMKETPLPIFHE